MIKQRFKSILHSVIGRYEILKGQRLNYRELKRYKRELSFLDTLDYDAISFRMMTAALHGASLEHCLRIIKKYTTIKDKKLLIIGVGKGEEIHRWMKEQPATIMAVEYLDYQKYWEKILYPNVKIIQRDIRDFDFGDQFDLMTSKAVLEHINGFDIAFPKIIKHLKTGGYFWADFGPLYYTWGGAHTRFNYDHLLLSESDYYAKLKSSEYEEAKLFWDNGLFSKMTYNQYIDCFNKFMDKIYLGLEISEQGLNYRNKNPESFNMLHQKYNERDLLLKSIFYLGRKK